MIHRWETWFLQTLFLLLWSTHSGNDVTWHVAAAAAAKSLQSCPTLCDPLDGSPPGSPVPGILQEEHWSELPLPSPVHETEKWKSSRSVVSDSSQPSGLFTTVAYQALLSVGFSKQAYWSGNMTWLILKNNIWFIAHILLSCLDRYRCFPHLSSLSLRIPISNLLM